MKREELKALGLADDVIDKIMGINGSDIEAQKAKLTPVQTELDGLKAQLTEANKQIDSFKGLDIDGIKKAADDYKTKFEQAQTEAAKQVSQLKFDHALEQALAGAKARNPKAVKALLDTEGLKVNDDGTIEHLDERLKAVKEANDYLFEGATPTPQVVAHSNSQSVKNMSAFEAAMWKGFGAEPPKE